MLQSAISKKTPRTSWLSKFLLGYQLVKHGVIAWHAVCLVALQESGVRTFRLSASTILAMDGGCMEEDFRGKWMERRKILMVGKGDLFTEEAVDYVIHIAGCLDYDILAVHVGRGRSGAASLDSEDLWRQGFSRRAAEDSRTLVNKALRKGIACAHGVKFGDLDTVVREFTQEIKRIEFIVADATVNRMEIGCEINIPVFGVVSQSLNAQGGRIMAKEQSLLRKKPWGRTLGFGAITAALYAAVFINADTVTTYFAMGGWHAVLPISTVFVFSFAHGAFAGNLWSLLGIEAVKRSTLREVERKVVQKRKHARKRPRAYAYINPFHRL